MACLGLYNSVTNKVMTNPSFVLSSRTASSFGSFGDWANFVGPDGLTSIMDITNYEPAGTWGENGTDCLYSQIDSGIIFSSSERFTSSTPYPDGLGVVCKMTNNGTVVWEAGGSATLKGGGINKMAYLPNGNIVACGFLLDGAGAYNILIINAETGVVIQKLTATLHDKYMGLNYVAVYDEDASFVVVGDSDPGETTENVFKYTWNGSAYELDWDVLTFDGDDCWGVAVNQDNGDVAISTQFRVLSPTLDANYNLHVYDKDGTFIEKFHPGDSIWDDHGDGFDTWSNLTNKEGYEPFFTEDGALYNATQYSLWEYETIATTYAYVDEVDIDNGTYENVLEFHRTSTKDKFFCVRMTDSSRTATFCVFDVTDNSFQNLFTGVDLTSAQPWAYGSAFEKRPRMLSKGSGHHFPLFRAAVSAFTDYDFVVERPETDVGDNNYSEDDFVVCGSGGTDATTETAFVTQYIRQAQQNGNFINDKFSAQDSKKFNLISESGPEPFTHKHYSVRFAQKVYNPVDGKFYRALKTNSGLYDTSNATYWREVDAPTQQWDSYAFLGLGGQTSATSPQVYTVSIQDVLDTDGNPHSANGVYLCRHHFGDKTSKLSSGIFKYILNGFNGKGQLVVRYHISTPRAAGYTVPYKTTLTVSNEIEIPKWQAGDSYDTDEYTKIYSSAWAYYKAKSDAVTVTPPNVTYWTSIGATRPNEDIFDITFDSDDGTDDEANNHGIIMSADQEANELNDTSTNGHDGTCSFFPTKIKTHSADTSYLADQMCVFEGRFYRADNDNEDSEPPSGDWTVQA